MSQRRSVDELIQRSSLGTPAAKRLRSLTSDKVVWELRQRVRQLELGADEQLAQADHELGDQPPTVGCPRSPTAHPQAPSKAASPRGVAQPALAALPGTPTLVRSSGELDSFEVFYQTSAAAVFRVCLVLSLDRALAEDAVSDAFTRAFVHWDKLASHPNPKAWLIMTARRSLLYRWRRGVDQLQFADLASLESKRPINVGDPSAGILRDLDVERALRQLPRRQREVVVLRYIGDLAVAEVAAVLGVSQGTVKAHQHSALRRLRKLLDGGAEASAPRQTQLREANLQGAHLEEEDLSRADLRRATLTGAHLERANLVGADLRGANLAKAHLAEASMGSVLLHAANLERANLQSAVLRQARLNDADLRGADLTGADLEMALLFRACLQGANLEGVHLEDTVLRSARIDKATLLPRSLDEEQRCAAGLVLVRG